MSFDYKMLIAGDWVGSDCTREMRSLSNDEVLGHLPLASSPQVETAIAAASQAREIMANLPAAKRAEILEKTSDLVHGRRDEFTLVIVHEAGKAWKWAQAEVKRAIENLKFAAEEAKRIHGETVPMDASAGSENRMGFWLRVPVGVVGAISPFNFPLNLVIHKVAPAIAAGNAVVLKPASMTPGPAQLLGECLLETGLPRHALNIVYGSGSTVGEAIVRDERIGKITFTGSPPVGRRIKEICGLKKVTLELGSNSGTIVDRTADLELAVSRCVMGSFAYNGQVCISVQRIYLHDEIAEEFTRRFVEATGKLVIGDPMDPNTDIGPMISEADARRVEEWVNEAVASGAEILVGGKRRGQVFEPTVISNVSPDMKVVCKEAFAPIVSLVRFTEFDDALNMLEDSIYGLQAGIFTRDIGHAFKAVKRLNVGGVMINDVPTYRADHMPYGGNKESGMGREGARFAIEEMTNLKMVCFNL